VDRSELLDALSLHAKGIVAAGRRGDLTAPVPGCPGWTLTDLIWHVGRVYDFWGYVVASRPAAPADYERPVRPDDGGAVVAWCAERAAALIDVLREADPGDRVWSWTGTDEDVAWVVRRMAHESAVHRVDADAATGVAFDLDAGLAADGIDEFLTCFLGARVPGAPEPPPIGGSVHLHCTDAAGEWMVVDGEDGVPAVTREHAKGDVALRDTAASLLAVLWRRQPLDSVARFGDDAVAEAFLAAARTG